MIVHICNTRYWKPEECQKCDSPVTLRCFTLMCVCKCVCSPETVRKCVCVSVFARSLSPVCDAIWLSHCCRHLKKRAAEKVSRPKVNVAAGGRYTSPAGNQTHRHRPPPSTGVTGVQWVFLSGVVDNNHLALPAPRYRRPVSSYNS